MDSYTKWKPRKISAKRNFPDAFYDESGTLIAKRPKAFEGNDQDLVAPDDFIPLETDSVDLYPKWRPRKISAKRNFPDAFYDESGTLIAKGHKPFEDNDQDLVLPDDFIPLETDSEDSYTKCKWKPRKTSAKRNFPDAFYNIIKESGNQSPVFDEFASQLAEEHQECESTDDNYQDNVGVEEGFADKRMLDLSFYGNHDFIPLEETDSLSSGCCSSSESRDSSYEIIPHLVNTVNPSEEELDTKKKNKWLNYKACSDDDDDDDDDEEVEGKMDEKAEIVKLGGYTELKLEFAVDNLQKNVKIDVESLGKESVTERVTNEQIGSWRRRGRVPAVRCFPPGCGPGAEFLTDEELKEAIEGSRNHTLTCKSCCHDEIEFDE